jgi:hypothetical protein
MRSRRDSTQAQIVAALEQIGCSVLDLSQVADRARWKDEHGQHQLGGCPDLLASGIDRRSGQRVTVLIEVKSVRGQLRQAQRHFAACWRGQVAVVRTVAEAQAVFGVGNAKGGATMQSV